MCGRYTFFTDKELQEVDDIIEKINNDIQLEKMTDIQLEKMTDIQLEKMKVGEIFPTNVAPVFLGERDIVVPKLMTWGFPNFKNKGVIINARAETVKEKRLFCAALERRRCIIPSTGFYEWNSEKKKYLFTLPDSNMLYMAGVYSQFEGESRFVILTTEAASSMADVHNRMPVVIPKDRIEDWVFDFNRVDDILFGQHPSLIKVLA